MAEEGLQRPFVGAVDIRDKRLSEYTLRRNYDYRKRMGLCEMSNNNEL
jgi:hypothetical protein